MIWLGDLKQEGDQAGGAADRTGYIIDRCTVLSYFFLVLEKW